jgi:soluble P-type ATPase
VQHQDVYKTQLQKKERFAMLTVDIPGYQKVTIQHVVCDFNGTIAIDGKLLRGVASLMNELSHHATFHVITADTFGSVKEELKHVHCNMTIIPETDQAEHKLDYVSGLGLETTVCIGNGRNDRLMVKEAVLGIGLVQAEGMSGNLLAVSDIVCPSIIDALTLFKETKRLIATLRN